MKNVINTMLFKLKYLTMLNSNLLLVRKIVQYNKTPNNTINSGPNKTQFANDVQT